MGLCAACLPGCLAKATTGADFIQTNHDRLMDDFDQFFDFVRKPADVVYGSQETSAIIAESRRGYENILPEIPYIGGDDNSLTGVLFLSAGALVFYRVMLKHGYSLAETGRILFQAMERSAENADPLSGADARLANGKAAQNEFRRLAGQLTRSPYPGDWKATFIEGDGVNFDYGIDYTTCGIVKFYQSQNASELAPYLCLGDFPTSIVMNTGLVRTSTLACGGSCCDFRFKAGRPVRMEWTPDFLKK